MSEGQQPNDGAETERDWDGPRLDAFERELGLSAAEIARAIGVDFALYLAWKSGERFATKRSVERLLKLRISALQRPATAPAPEPAAPTPPLAHGRLWAIVERLQAEPALLDECERWLASRR